MSHAASHAGVVSAAAIRRRGLRPQLGRLLALGILLLVATLAAVAAPRVTTRLADSDFRQTVSDTGASTRDLLAPVRAGGNDYSQLVTGGAVAIGPTWRAMPKVLAASRATMAPDLRSVTGTGRFTGLAPTSQLATDSAVFSASGTPGAPIGTEQLSVEAYPWLRADSRLVAGRWPAAGSADGVLEVVLTRKAARDIGWTIGESQRIGGTFTQRTVQLVGTIEPRDTGSDYWTLNTSRAVMSINYDDQNDRFNHATMWVDAGSWPDVGPSLNGSLFDSWFPVHGAAFEAAKASSVQASLARYLSAPVPIADGTGSDNVLRVSSTLSPVLDTFRAKAIASSSILAVSTAGPLGVAALAVVLSLRMLVVGGAPVRALLRARGAGIREQAGGVARDAALVCVPAAAVGTALAILAIPDPPLAQALVTGAVCVVVPPLIAFLAVLASEGLSGRVRRGFAGRSWVLEVVLVLLAAAAVVVAIGRGSAARGAGGAATSAADPLVVATPLLLAAAACVLVLRGFPQVLRFLAGPVRTRGGAGSFVGVIAATREPGRAFWIVAAALTATSVGVLSLVLVSSESAGSRTATAATGSLGVTTIRTAPLVAGIGTVAVLALVLATALSAAAFVSTLVAETPERRLRSAALQRLGFAPGQLGRVTAWSLVPAAVSSVVVGTGLGLLTAALLLPAIDPSRSSKKSIPVEIDWPLVAAVAGAVLASALLAGLAASLADRHRLRLEGRLR